MCGIAGLIVRRGLARPSGRADAGVARAMAAALAHRGPDGEGAFEAATFGPFALALGHRRLAIIDRSDAAREPFPNEDGSVQLVFNGEIYNHRALRGPLEMEGHRFRSRSDAEAAVHLYEARGPLAALGELRGMFALAIADLGRGRLVLARDPPGKKPLYYAARESEDGSGALEALLFASEPAGIFAAALAGGPAVSREPDPAALDDYLAAGYISAPFTGFKAVRKLEPGTALIVEDGRARIERYARFGATVPGEGAPGRGLPSPGPGALRRAVVAAVRARLESDVPLGAFLSGGIDSTIVSGLLAREAGRRIATFSIGFEDPRWDETRYSRAAARRFGTDHYERTIGARAYDALPELIFRHGEPFADESAIATYGLAAFARERVTVALTGDGGDELFLGYRHHRAARALAAIDRVAPRWVRRGLGRLAPPPGPEKSLRRQAARLIGALGAAEPERYLAWAGIFPGRGARIAALVRERGGIERYDLEVYLPDDLLAKVDRATMAHGLEARSPLLDPAVAAIAARIPARAKAPLPWRGKAVLIRAFRDLLPPEIVARPKMGFGVPAGAWFRGPLRDLAREVLLSGRARGRGVVPEPEIAALLEAHLAGREEHGRRLHALLALEAWFRAYVDPPVAPALPSW